MRFYFYPFLFGFLTGSVTFWFQVYTETFLGLNVYLLLIISSFFLSLVLNLFQRNAIIKNSLLLWLSAEVAVFLGAIFDITFIDPSSRNLLGLEIILTSICIFPSSLVGGILTKLFLGKKK